MDLGERDGDFFADLFAAPDPRCSISLRLINRPARDLQ